MAVTGLLDILVLVGSELVFRLEKSRGEKHFMKTGHLP